MTQDRARTIAEQIVERRSLIGQWLQDDDEPGELTEIVDLKIEDGFLKLIGADWSGSIRTDMVGYSDAGPGAIRLSAAAVPFALSFTIYAERP